MNEKRVIICDGCNRALGIPAYKTSLEVICPRPDCKARFFWRLDTNQPDWHKLQSADYVRKLTGVCAGKKRFKVVFVKQRTDPYYRFPIMNRAIAINMSQTIFLRAYGMKKNALAEGNSILPITAFTVVAKRRMFIVTDVIILFAALKGLLIETAKSKFIVRTVKITVR